MEHSAFLGACRALLGDAHVISDEAEMAPYLRDWRGRFTGRALGVLRPADTEQVAATVKLCLEARIPMVPQGGNTGLVLGSVPDASGTAVVLSLARMQKVRKVDAVNRTMTVDAGVILQNAQDAAAEQGCLFPLSLAAEGSCTIGGNLSTNAGGTGVLRYGNTRELCLGLEVVTPQGDIWSGLRGLRKDNTGYDLRDLFIGAEGTLGIITGAVLKLYPQPKASVTALAAMESPAAALRLLSIMQDHCGASLTGFELMSAYCMRLVAKHFPALPQPLSGEHAQYALLELSSSESEQHAAALLERALGAALDEGVAQDAVVASSATQSRGLWDRASIFHWHRRQMARTSSTIFRFRCPRLPISSPAPSRGCRRHSPAANWCASATWAMATCISMLRRQPAWRTKTSCVARRRSTVWCTMPSPHLAARFRPSMGLAR